MLTRFGIPALIILHEVTTKVSDVVLDFENYLAEWRRLLEV